MAAPPGGYPVYKHKVPRTWWLRTGPYRRFAAREVTSFFAALFSVILFLFLLALSRGPPSYEAFLRWLDLAGIVVLSAVILAALLYHAATWLRLTAHILQIRVGRTLIPGGVVAGALVAAWVGVSGLVAYFHIWF